MKGTIDFTGANLTGLTIGDEVLITLRATISSMQADVIQVPSPGNEDAQVLGQSWAKLYGYVTEIQPGGPHA